jgi:hypothetical protein
MKRMKKEGKDEVKPIDYVQIELISEALELQEKIDKRAARQQSLKWQNILLVIISIEFGFVLVFTASVIVLEGFGLFGFSVGEKVINALIASTIGAVAGLLTIALKTIFGSRNE